MYLCSVLYVLGVMRVQNLAMVKWVARHYLILYKQSLQWWFRCIRLQPCVGPVCVRGTALMCRGRECARLGSATRRVSFYASLSDGGLRPSGSSSGSSSSVRIYMRAREHYTPNVYRCTCI